MVILYRFDSIFEAYNSEIFKFYDLYVFTLMFSLIIDLLEICIQTSLYILKKNFWRLRLTQLFQEIQGIIQETQAIVLFYSLVLLK